MQNKINKTVFGYSNYVIVKESDTDKVYRERRSYDNRSYDVIGGSNSKSILPRLAAHYGKRPQPFIGKRAEPMWQPSRFQVNDGELPVVDVEKRLRRKPFLGKRSL